MCPLAFLIEKAGGQATDGTMAILDIQIQGFEQKANMICGSKEDVLYISDELNTEGNVSGTKGSYANLLEIQGKFSNSTNQITTPEQVKEGKWPLFPVKIWRFTG